MIESNNICRACLIYKESFNYHLFGNVPAETYYYCTSIEVFADEDLPKSLCDECHEKLTKFSDFKRTCAQSQNSIVSFKNNLKVESAEADLLDSNPFYREPLKTKIEPQSEDDIHDYGNILDDFLDDGNEDIQKPEPLMVAKTRKAKKLCKIQYKTKVRKPFSYTCEICNKKFGHEDRYEAHKTLHDGKIVSINCTVCSKTFMTWSGLQRHNESTHTVVNLESLRCRTCGKIFKSRQTLKMHQQLHQSRMSYICDVCGKCYTNKCNLKIHLEIHSDNRERHHTCEHCGKKFFTKRILFAHISRRHSDKRYICQICSYPFTEKSNLAKHLLIHEGKKPYKCDICERSYVAQSCLVEHRRTHTGERPYPCNYCGKCFSSRRRLVDHHRIHTGEKPHKCGVCEQRFTQRGTMKRHMKVHNRIVPANSVVI